VALHVQHWGARTEWGPSFCPVSIRASGEDKGGDKGGRGADKVGGWVGDSDVSCCPCDLCHLACCPHASCGFCSSTVTHLLSLSLPWCAWGVHGGSRRLRCCGDTCVRAPRACLRCMCVFARAERQRGRRARCPSLALPSLTRPCAPAGQPLPHAAGAALPASAAHQCSSRVSFLPMRFGQCSLGAHACVSRGRATTCDRPAGAAGTDGCLASWCRVSANVS